MINLLPAKIKKEQKLKQISKQVNMAMVMILIMICMAYTAVYLVDYFLSSQIDERNALLAQANNDITRLKPIEDDINSINSKITKLSSLKGSRYEWSTVISDINNSVPKSVQIKTLLLDHKDGKIVISAAAETRGDIVKLQASLEDLPYLKNMSFESSTYNDADNNFSFNMTGAIGK